MGIWRPLQEQGPKADALLGKGGEAFVREWIEAQGAKGSLGSKRMKQGDFAKVKRSNGCRSIGRVVAVTKYDGGTKYRIEFDNGGSIKEARYSELGIIDFSPNRGDLEEACPEICNICNIM